LLKHLYHVLEDNMNFFFYIISLLPVSSSCGDQVKLELPIVVQVLDINAQFLTLIFRLLHIEDYEI
jgi:hypothetical protein